jgi:dTMP kinase
MKPRFITLEGIDGAGKSTHMRWIAERLRKRGSEVVTTREPGGSPLAEKLRELLLREPMDAETEALLLFTARRDHLEQIITPALKRGAYVVCDRFTDATFAYQGGGKGVPIAKLQALEEWVPARPDLTLLFDCPVSLAASRLKPKRDRFESEGEEFFARVRQAYLARARSDPARIRIIDSSRDIDEVRASVEAIVFPE